MRPWHTIGLEQRGLVPIRKRSGPAAFSYWRKPADGGGLFAEQQVSRARGGQGFQEELQGDHRHSDKICDGSQEPYAGAGGPGALPDLRVPDPAQPGGQHREHLRRGLPGAQGCPGPQGGARQGRAPGAEARRAGGQARAPAAPGQAAAGPAAGEPARYPRPREEGSGHPQGRPGEPGEVRRAAGEPGCGQDQADAGRQAEVPGPQPAQGRLPGQQAPPGGAGEDAPAPAGDRQKDSADCQDPRRHRRGRAGLPHEEDRRRGGQDPDEERRHGLPQRRHRLRHRRHHCRGAGLQGGKGGHCHHRGAAHRHRRGQGGGSGAPRPRGGGHGPRRPRQDLPAGLYPQRPRGGGRGRRHHPAHRRLSGERAGQDHYLPGHPRPRGLHRHARPRRHDHRCGHPGGGRRRRHHAPDG